MNDERRTYVWLNFTCGKIIEMFSSELLSTKSSSIPPSSFIKVATTIAYSTIHHKTCKSILFGTQRSAISFFLCLCASKCENKTKQNKETFQLEEIGVFMKMLKLLEILSEAGTLYDIFHIKISCYLYKIRRHCVTKTVYDIRERIA